MEYKDVEEAWQQRVGQLTARYESELVAMSLNSKEQAKQLMDEIERLTNELEAAKATSPSPDSTS